MFIPSRFISYGKQNITEDDEKAIINVLRSDYLTQGPYVEEFEEKLAEYTGAKYCVVFSNATAALHIAVKSLDIPSNSFGITTPITFVASSNALLYNNIKVKFADIDKKTYNICHNDIKKKLDDKVKVLIPVHFAGQACDMEEISKIAKTQGVHVIEDASHSIGSTYRNGCKVGCCRYSDMTVFSFHPVKTLTTGEGGAVTTNSKIYYDRLKMLRSHGITKDNSRLSYNPGPWYYEMQSLGFNYRLTDIQASLGISQLKRLEDVKRKRTAIVAKYNSAFSNHTYITTPYEEAGLSSCFHLYVLLIDFEKIGISRKEFMMGLNKMKIGTQVHYIPVYHQPYYRKHGFNNFYLTNTEEYYCKCLSLPLFPTLTDNEIDYIISNVLKLINKET